METKKLSKGENITPSVKPVLTLQAGNQTKTVIEKPKAETTGGDQLKNLVELQEQNRILLKKLEELEKIRVHKPANIQEVIQFYQEKKRIIDLCSLLKDKLLIVEGLQKEVKQQIENKELEAEKFYLYIGKGDGKYSTEKAVVINNPLVIENAIEFVKNTMKNKIDFFEKQIQA
jgi:hypothetical protein